MDSSTKNDWETSLYVLGERLHMPVYKIKAEMPLSELMGWHRYFAEQQKPDDSINLADMTEADLGRMFG